MHSVREYVLRDLVLVGLCTLLAAVTVLVPVPLLRVPFGVLLALFLPGYAVVAALFPAFEQFKTDADPPPAWIEHAMFAVGGSILTMTVVALALNFSPFGIELVPLVLGLTAVTLLSLGVAAVRRRRSTRKRESSSFLSAALDDLSGGSSRYGRVVNAVLIVSLLLVAGSVAYAVTASNQGDSYTEFYLLAENESGQLVTSDYPTEFVKGESQTLHLGIDNHEGTQVNYTVVVKVERIRTKNGSTTVLQGEELKRMHVRVGPGGSTVVKHRVAPTMVGGDLRLTYLLYKDEPPADPSVKNAYQNLYLLVDVSENKTTIS